MEAIGAVAGIVALVQLSAKLVELSCSYIEEAKQAPKNSRELAAELKSLSEVLIVLEGYTNKNPQAEALRVLNSQAGPILECILELEELQRKLDPNMRKGLKKVFRSLKWPLKEAETMQIIARIERQKSLFNIAMNTDHIHISNRIDRNVQGIGYSFEEFLGEYREDMAAQNFRRQNKDTIRKEKKRQEVLNWLYPESTDIKHTEVSKNRQKNTARWLLQSPELQEWASDRRKSSLLWGYGIPGAGKTYLSSAVIDHFQNLARTKNYGVAYIYFSYKEQDQQKAIHILSSLIKQLAYQTPQLPSRIEELHDAMVKGGKRPTLENLYPALLVTIKLFHRAFFIFDALDECDPKEQRKEILPLMHRMGNDRASLFLTSRDYPLDIRISLRDVSHIRLSANRDDIRYYIKEKINGDYQAKHLVQQGAFEERIISELTECANGMFLLVRFNLDYVCQQATAKQMLTALEKLKKSSTAGAPLDPTYDRAIKNLGQGSKSRADLALKVLTWLVTAKRTLTVNEIRAAVSVEEGRYELDELDLPDRRMILEVCASLVTIDEDNDIVRLAHFTVQEYLLRKSIIPKDANLTIAIACTTYLSFDIFTEFANAEKVRLEAHPFLGYAALYLYSHLKDCDENKSEQAVFKFVTSSGNVSSYFSVLRYFPRHNLPQISLHWASVGHSPRAPIHIASALGHFLVTQRLIKRGASTMDLDRNKSTALIRAAERGHEAVVRLLLDNGADASTQGERGEVALVSAAAGGYEAVAQLLIDRGAGVSARNNFGNTALIEAAKGGHEAVVRLLLDNGADASPQDDWGIAAFYGAAAGGHVVVVQLLLDNGADASAWDEDFGDIALIGAAQGGHKAVVQLLLDNGADVSARDHYGNIALVSAAAGGYEAVVQLLLDNGTDVSAQDRSGNTALTRAAEGGHEAVARLLLDNGADASTQDRYGETALSKATKWGCETVVQVLLNNRTDVPAPNPQGRTVHPRKDIIQVPSYVKEPLAG